MKILRKFLLSLALGFIAFDAAAMELDDYFDSLVHVQLEMLSQPAESLLGKQTLNEKLLKDERIKNCVVQKVIDTRVKKARKAKQKIAVSTLVVDVIHKIFGCSYSINENAKKIINDAIDPSLREPLIIKSKNHPTVVWYVSRALYYLHIYEVMGTIMWLEEFAKENKEDDGGDLGENVFVYDVLKNLRVRALMRDELMMCFLFVIDKKILIQMIQEVLWKIKLSLPSAPCKKFVFEKKSFDALVEKLHSLKISIPLMVGKNDDKKSALGKEKELGLDEEDDKELAAIASRFDHSKFISQSMIDVDSLDCVDQLLEEGDPLAAFLGILANCLQNLYEKQ